MDTPIACNPVTLKLPNPCGAHLLALVQRMYATPKEVIDLVAKLMK